MQVLVAISVRKLNRLEIKYKSDDVVRCIEKNDLSAMVNKKNPNMILVINRMTMRNVNPKMPHKLYSRWLTIPLSGSLQCSTPTCPHRMIIPKDERKDILVILRYSETGNPCSPVKLNRHFGGTVTIWLPEEQAKQ
jgi:hypothetical protein